MCRSEADFISKIKVVSQVDPVACVSKNWNMKTQFEEPHVSKIQTVCYGHKTWPLEVDPYRWVFQMWLCIKIEGQIQFTPLFICWELPPFLPGVVWRWPNQRLPPAVTFNPLAPSTESARMGLRISMISLRASEQTVRVLIYWRVVHWKVNNK